MPKLAGRRQLFIPQVKREMNDDKFKFLNYRGVNAHFLFYFTCQSTLPSFFF